MNSLPTVSETSNKIWNAGAKLTHNQLDEILQQDRTLIADTLLAEVEGKIRTITEEDRMESAFGALADEQYNQALTDIKQMITRVLKENV